MQKNKPDIEEHSHSVFDAAAASYDNDFTLTEIGKRQRERVVYWLEKSGIISNSLSVFEMNCGTGYDADWFFNKGHKIIATDASSEMIKVARSKRNKNIEFYKLRFQDVLDDPNVEKADLVFSNFGGLNCLSEKDISTFFNHLAEQQKVGDKLAMVIMPKHCPLEDLYLLLEGKPSQMGRRNRKNFIEVDVNGEKVKTYYHSPNTIKQLLWNNYKIKLTKSVATFLPPSYAEPFFKKRSGLLKILNFFEHTFGRLSFLASRADHYIIIAERK